MQSKYFLPLLALLAATSCAELPTNQVLWSNGTLGQRWFGNALGEASNNPRLGRISLARVTDSLTGASPVLCYEGNGESDPSGFVGGVVFYNSPGPSPDASGYYPAGHVQFDIELGPSFDPATNSVEVFYGDGSNGNCGSDPLPGLSKAAFKRVSLPLNGFAPGCNHTQAVNFLSITCSQKSGAKGVLFYVNDVQWKMD
jgi:hypothetical protein